jgi:hypothetical protein
LEKLKRQQGYQLVHVQENQNINLTNQVKQYQMLEQNINTTDNNHASQA